MVQETGTELETALDRLIQADLLLLQGVPPHANYLFKHSLVQEAAYGMLLREPRRALHARIAETLESQFAEIAESQPELVARHYTEAGLIAKAAGLWGKAGERSLARSALVEAAAQLTRALEQMATLPSTPALRREQIKLQIALAHALMHTKGYAAPETKASFKQARLYIEEAEAARTSLPTIHCCCSPSSSVSGSRTMWHSMGTWCATLRGSLWSLRRNKGQQSRLWLGIALREFPYCSRAAPPKAGHHLDQAIALYDPAEHRPLATRFGQDSGVASLTFRSWALMDSWLSRGRPRGRRAGDQGSA